MRVETSETRSIKTRDFTGVNEGRIKKGTRLRVVVVTVKLQDETLGRDWCRLESQYTEEIFRTLRDNWK